MYASVDSRKAGPLKVFVVIGLAVFALTKWVSPARSAVEEGLVLYLNAANNSGQDFDAQATTWTDLSGKGNNGVLRNYDTPTWVGSGQPGDPYCLQFNGQGNYVEIAQAASLDTPEAFTIEALVRIRQGSLKAEEMAPFLAKGGMGSGGDYNLQVRLSGQIGRLFVNAQIKDKNEDILNTGPIIELDDDTFGHYVFSYDTNSEPHCKWYVNGALIGTSNQKFELVANDNPLAIGSHQTGEKHRLQGDIAYVRLYSRALTAEEAQQNHAEAVTIVPAVAEPPKVLKKVEEPTVKGLTAEQARVCVTGADHNRPDHFPGLGDFIGWVGGVARMPDGDLLFVHSAGYWHSSFAWPMVIGEETRKRWEAGGWPLDHKAPTGGRTMGCRSSDNGKTWSKPFTIYDDPQDDGPDNIFVTREGTVLVFVNVQANWYGLSEAPEGLQELNTKQLVLRSTDGGKTWSEPIAIESAGDYYSRSHSNCIQLPDGGILWQTYDMDKGGSRLYGVIHRSDDDGKSWQVISTIRQEDVNVDEGDMVRLSNGRLVMVVRPDGGVYVSDDDGVTWRRTGQMVTSGKVKAPATFVLSDDTIVCTCTYGGLQVFLSSDGGETWTDAIPLDTSCYGYPKGSLMEDESILLGYVKSGAAPNRCYLIRFRVNENRDGIQLLSIGEETNQAGAVGSSQTGEVNQDWDAILGEA